MMPTSTAVTAAITALFGATVTWATGLTKLGFANKARIDVLETRTDSLTQTLDESITEVKQSLIRQDAKLDRLVEHMLREKEE